MKILHLPTATGKVAWSLAQGEKALGLDSRVLVTRSSSFEYPADENLHLEALSGRTDRIRILARTFAKVRSRYDVFHFNFGQTLFTHPRLPFFPHPDLPFYKGRLFATYNGCDARQKRAAAARRPISACADPACGKGVCDNDEADRFKQAGIRMMARHVRHIWAMNPDLLDFLPEGRSSFLPYAVDMDGLPLKTPTFAKKRLNVVHAPTNRETKGSAEVLAALDEVNRRTGGAVNLTLVEGLPHHQALAVYEKADLVIDQVKIGWYGGLAVEVMAMGKPVACYVNPQDAEKALPGMAKEIREAMILVTPETLADTLEAVLDDRAALRQKARAAAEFARKWHHPRFVASLTKAAYEKD